MPGLRVLNSRKVKALRAKIMEQWGADFRDDYVFLENGSSRVFIASKDIGKIGFSGLRVQSIGTYFCEQGAGELRLSIEGSQLVGPLAIRNIAELDDDEAASWMKGLPVGKRLDCNGFVIIRNREDYMGSGRYIPSQSRIANYVPKARRLNELL